MPDTAVFDVDGTLVDTNYHHALARYRAIGVGRGTLVVHVASQRAEKAYGDALRTPGLRRKQRLDDLPQPVGTSSPLSRSATTGQRRAGQLPST